VLWLSRTHKPTPRIKSNSIPKVFPNLSGHVGMTLAASKIPIGIWDV
jgi:hypothetical protein